MVDKKILKDAIKRGNPKEVDELFTAAHAEQNAADAAFLFFIAIKQIEEDKNTELYTPTPQQLDIIFILLEKGARPDTYGRSAVFNRFYSPLLRVMAAVYGVDFAQEAVHPEINNGHRIYRDNKKRWHEAHRWISQTRSILREGKAINKDAEGALTAARIELEELLSENNPPSITTVLEEQLHKITEKLASMRPSTPPNGGAGVFSSPSRKNIGANELRQRSPQRPGRGRVKED